MDREEIITGEEENIGEVIAEEPVKENKRKLWPVITVTAVITIFVTMAITTALFFLTYGARIDFVNRYNKLFELDRIIAGNYIGDADLGPMLDEAAAGLVYGMGDRWSSYMTAEELASYANRLANSYVGVGISVTKAEGEYVLISEVNPEGGAYDAGLLVGDYIKAVEGTDIKALAFDEVSPLIKGEEGTFVNLLIERDGTEFTVSVERRSIPEKSVHAQMIGNVGYVKIINFNDHSASQFVYAVNNLKEQGAESFVFDVRFNVGGYLKELHVMLDYVLPEGVIFKTEDIRGNFKTIDSDAECLEAPIAILINDRSISAAEYFAAVISEYGRGTLVGAPTIGKGYSQRLFYLSDGSAVNLSTAKYYTPNGVCLVNLGLTPDISVEVDDEEYAAGYYNVLSFEEDSQLQAAINAVK